MPSQCITARNRVRTRHANHKFFSRSELEFYFFTWERLEARAASTKRANYGEITEGFTIIRSPIETIIRERRKSLRF